MTKEERFNGWQNYETWAVELWIKNKKNSYNYWRERAKELKEEGGDLITLRLSEKLEEDFDENNPCEEACIYTDLLYSALCNVNWEEIAESILEEVSK